MVTSVKPKPAEYSSLELWEPGETVETLKSDVPLVIVAPDVTLVPESLLIDPAWTSLALALTCRLSVVTAC